ncbi:hypothetical protein ACUALU_29695, partial [Nocardiopsis changdeensis]
MRTANDGRGDETWEEPAPSSAAPDDDATRVMSRADLPASVTGPSAPAAGPAAPLDEPVAVSGPNNPDVPGDADATAVFSRGTGPDPFAARGSAPAADVSDTREFSRAPQSSTTREFTRGVPAADDAPDPA